MTFAARVIAAQHLLVAPCARCKALCSADPSLRANTRCMKCHALLKPRRLVCGVEFVEAKAGAA